MSELRPGDHLHDYVVERELGRGGMDAVYLARHERLNRRVALKVIVASLAADPEFRRRFERESRVASSLEHPHIVPVYDVGDDDGTLFIAMRYIAGQDLATLLRDSGPVIPHRFVRLFEQACSALDEAHRAGLVHRDVKPANLLLAGTPSDEHAYLTDFGLTRDAASDSGLTGTGQWIGTIDYVAPEQIDGGRVDGRTDVYAAACLAFHVLTGRPPYEGGMAAKLHGHLSGEPPRASTVASVPAGVDEVLSRGLAKEPDARHPSAGDLARDLTAAVTGIRNAKPERTVATGRALTGIPTVQSPTAHPPPTAATAAGRVEPRSPGTRRRAASAPTTAAPASGPRSGASRMIATVAATVALLGAGAAAAVLLNRDDGSLSTEQTPTTEDTPAVVTETVERIVPAKPKPSRRGRGRRNPSAAVPQATPAPAPASTEPAVGATLNYTSPSGFYSAEFPAGSAWRVIGESELNPGLLRTTLQGPAGGTVWIDVTPAEPPGFDNTRVAVQADRTLGGGIREIVFGLGGPDFCAAAGSCALYQLNYGDAGIAVIGGPSADARATARRIATTADGYF